MARCQFTIDFTGTAEELIGQARQGITSANGQFEGDAGQGVFLVPTPLGSMKGTYAISGTRITIMVQDKPMLLGCGRIESELRKFIG